MRRLQILPWLAAVAMTACVSASTLAQDMLKLAVGAPGNWDTCIPEVGQRAGIFKKHGLALELLYTQGGGETMQAVISGSVADRHRGRHCRRDGRVRQGRAGAHPRGRNDRHR